MTCGRVGVDCGPLATGGAEALGGLVLGGESWVDGFF